MREGRCQYRDCRETATWVALLPKFAGVGFDRLEACDAHVEHWEWVPRHFIGVSFERIAAPASPVERR